MAVANDLKVLDWNEKWLFITLNKQWPTVLVLVIEEELKFKEVMKGTSF